MNKLSISRFVKQFSLLFVPLLLCELLFRVFSAQTIQFIDILRSFLFVSSFSVVMATLLYPLSQRLAKIANGIVVGFFSMYALFQTGIKHYYGTYFSIQFAGKGMPDIGSYIADYLNYLKFEYFLFPSIFLIFLIFLVKAEFPARKSLKKPLIWGVCLAVTFHAMGVGSLFLFESAQQFETSYSLYKKPVYTEQAFYQLGLLRFLGSDISMLWQSSSAAPVPVEPDDDKKPDDPVAEEPETIDDTAWLAAIAAEGNESIKEIDEYLISRPQHQDNEYTGAFAGKNVIYVMVEAFDYIGLDPTLTPTLTKMMNEGWSFNQHYSIQYNCATGESELIAQTGLYPNIGTCSYSAYGDTNTYTQTLYNLFNQAGYTTTAYHNWNDQFYKRTKIIPTLGADAYYDVDQLIPKLIGGWQSDFTMMQNAWPIIKENGSPFFAQIITSSSHLPYDEESNLGDRYISQVNEVFPNAPVEVKRYMSKLIEFDKAMAYLLEQLENNGLADDTVIVLYGDHRPLKFNAGNLVTYTDEVDRSQNNDLDLTPMIIYNSELTPKTISNYSSNMDLVPTMANLFGLNYDSRLYLGTDVMVSNSLVVWQSGTWQNEVGFFSSTTSAFAPYDTSNTYTTEQIQTISNKIKNMFYYSREIYLNNYYFIRTFEKDN